MCLAIELVITARLIIYILLPWNKKDSIDILKKCHLGSDTYHLSI